MSDKSVKYPFARLGDVNAPYRDRMVQAMTDVVDSGQYIGGEALETFEQQLADFCQAPYAIGLTNGLDALRLMLRAAIELGMLGPGDEVIVPANTYVATILAISHNDLKPVLVEPDIDTLNLDTRLIDHAITPRTRAIMLVHLYGRTSWDQNIVDAARRHNLLVFEDNAQAIGACALDAKGLYGSQMTGALGIAGAFSFYPTKNIGALGDAGAVVTHDAELAQAVRALRNYGSLRQYDNLYQGFNCRLDPVKAAALSVKLPYADYENDQRRQRADLYNQHIVNPFVSKPLWTANADHVWHQYVVRVNNRQQFRDFLLAHGVETAVHYPTPPHRQPCYVAELGDLHLPVTEKICQTVVSLPITRSTSLVDIQAIANIINTYHE